MRNQSMFGCGGTMKRLNMFRKLIFGFLILTVVLTSGCINSYEQSQKTQPIITPTPIQTAEVFYPTPTPIKIINLDPSQLILSDEEVNKVLGSGWNKKGENPSTFDFSNYHAKLFSSFYMKDNNVASATIGIWRHPDNQQVLMKYRDIMTGQMRFNNDKGNDIDIGDRVKWFEESNELIDIVGKVYSKNKNVEVVFTKSNILIDIETNTVGIEKAVELAKKQDEKISKILGMIK